MRSRRGAFFERFALVAPSRLARFAFFVFAVIQLVAPSWHVCAWGGRCNDCPTDETGVAQCHAKPASQPANSPKPKCAQCQPVPQDGGWQADNSNDFKGTCLARELRGMPFAAMASLTLNFSVTRVRNPRPANRLARDVPSLPFTPSRGPPACL